VPAPTHDIEDLRVNSRMYDAVIEEIDGRRIRIGGDWLVDWASCNYLGFDLDDEVIEAVEPQLRKWGTHPSWSRMLGSPALYPQIEERLTGLLGAEDVLLLPTVSQIHLGVIPALIGEGTLIMESRAHRCAGSAAATSTSWNACSARPPPGRSWSAWTASTA
jgi:8-amino-7-oxononanoate synthase